MKKIILLAFVCIAVNKLQAQWYAGAMVGYGFPLAVTTEQSSTPTQFTTFNYSLGKGFTPQLFVGYPICNGIKAELGISRLFGGISSSQFADSSSTDDFSYQGEGFNLIPSIIIDPCCKYNNLSIFGRAGLNLGLGMRETETFEFNMGNYTENKTIVNKFNPALGLVGGIGVNYDLNKSSCVFIEFDATVLTGSQKSGEITEYEVNNVDQLANLPANQKSWTYEKEIAKVNPPANQRLRSSVSFSRTTANIGFRYHW